MSEEKQLANSDLQVELLLLMPVNLCAFHPNKLSIFRSIDYSLDSGTV